MLAARVTRVPHLAAPASARSAPLRVPSPAARPPAVVRVAPSSQGQLSVASARPPAAATSGAQNVQPQFTVMPRGYRYPSATTAPTHPASICSEQHPLPIRGAEGEGRRPPLATVVARCLLLQRGVSTSVKLELKAVDHKHDIIQPGKTNEDGHLEPTAIKADAETMCTGDENEYLEPEAIKADAKERRFYFNGKLARIDAEKFFYVQPREWTERTLFQRIEERTMGILYGPSQSGKTTRISDLLHLLRSKGYKPIYVAAPPMESDVRKWWLSFGQRLQAGLKESQPPCDSAESFQIWWGTLSKPVLFLDEADMLNLMPAVMESFLSTMKAVRDLEEKEQSVWLVGRYLTTSIVTKKLSPFNISSAFAAPLFSEAEVLKLFEQYVAQQRRKNAEFKLPRAIVRDVYHHTSGHQGLVNLCGTMLEALVKTMDGKAPSYEEWLSWLATNPVWETYAKSNNGKRIVSVLANTDLLELANQLLASPTGVALTTADMKEKAYQLAQHGVATIEGSEPAKEIAKLLCPAVGSLVRRQVFTRQQPLRLPIGTNAYDVLNLLKHVLPYVSREVFVDRNMQRKSASTPKSKPLPVEALYGHELHRVLSIAFGGTDLQLHPQRPLRTADEQPSSPDLVISRSLDAGKSTPLLVLELGVNMQLHYNGKEKRPPTKTLRYHINKTAEYAENLRVEHAWVVHFTNGAVSPPIDQPKDGSKVNVVHVKHDADFTTATFLDNNGNQIGEPFSLLPKVPPFLESFLRDEAKIDADGVKEYVPLLHDNKITEAKLYLLTDEMLKQIGIRLPIDRASILDAVRKRTLAAAEATLVA